MSVTRLFIGSTALLLTTGLAALAQSAPAPLPAPSSPPASIVFTSSSYTAAHDSLMSRVARVQAQTASIQSLFTATQGTMGGLHRRVKTYARIPSGLTNARIIFIKRQVIKHRYGIELEKVLYRDIKGRKLLTERYEGHQLTRLELFEHRENNFAPVASWLLVRGDYLCYRAAPVSLAYKRKQQKSYFFHALPAGQ